jgi:hypothetical protein
MGNLPLLVRYRPLYSLPSFMKMMSLESLQRIVDYFVIWLYASFTCWYVDERCQDETVMGSP